MPAENKDDATSVETVETEGNPLIAHTVLTALATVPIAVVIASEPKLQGWGRTLVGTPLLLGGIAQAKSDEKRPRDKGKLLAEVLTSGAALALTEIAK